ncbi:MAG: hypothetical protein GPOALKHO_000996 [Sodalis sp.]|nr:MAG: hypothetical protein GPOALKHO_000996 [Sodalis sp.]
MVAQSSRFIRWFTLAGAIITQFVLRSVYTCNLLNGPLLHRVSLLASGFLF